uniref:alkaline phosphatase n=1 Tax=Cacopsylla melanoneura TaxID=428564 RepID=A0A8D8YZV5_9HEMI
MDHLVVYLLFFNIIFRNQAQQVLDKDYWYKDAQEGIRRRLALFGNHLSDERAKNIILMVGDGMGLSTLTASRILKGQKLGISGEEYHLAWDKFPAVALAKTYNLDAQIGESSACATALSCGVKANYETLGLDGRGKFENCVSSFSARVESVLEWSQKAGKATGIVTNTRVTHATPAAFYGHSPSRYWEDDGKVPFVARKQCKDLARQLVEDYPGKDIDVIFGGGRRHWLPKVAKDPEDHMEEGRRLDGRNLVEDWLRDKRKRGIKAAYVWNKQQMDKLEMNVQQVLGLFAYSHMDFELDRDKSGDPSLAEMTIKALSILKRNSNGFFLFIESGRIDHAHHYNNPHRALDETLALEETLLQVLALVNLSETLIVVTADHSHVMTIGGMSTPRGNSILGMDSKVSDIDGLPYSTLLYSNGPGFSVPRLVPSNASATDKNSVHGSGVPRHWATHSGEDVPVYASGPLASVLLTGTMDQSYIPHALAYIACLGEYRERCNGTRTHNLSTSPTFNISKATTPPACIVPNNSRDAVVLASSVIRDDPGGGVAMNQATPTFPSSLVKYLVYSVAMFVLNRIEGASVVMLCCLVWVS